MADRLSVDKKVNDPVVKGIDDVKLLGLDKTNIERIELFLFAMAIGIKEGKRTPLAASHGFILESAINPSAMSKLYALLVHEMRKRNEEEKIGDKDAAFQVAQEYANTGFQIIQGWLNNLSVRDEEAILWDLIAELEDKFAQCFPDEE